MKGRAAESDGCNRQTAATSTVWLRRVQVGNESQARPAREGCRIDPWAIGATSQDVEEVQDTQQSFSGCRGG